MTTPEQEHAALMKEWDVVWAEQTDAWLAVQKKQAAVAKGGHDNPPVAEENPRSVRKVERVHTHCMSPATYQSTAPFNLS